MKRRLLISFTLVIALASIVYFALCWMLYMRLATVLPECAREYSANTPISFSADPFNSGLNTTPYTMPTYEAVSIPSRDPGISLSSWYIPANIPNAPAVLITHGLGVDVPDCKRSPRALMPAGMLHHAGYNILLIDLRDHGDSTIEDGLWAANTEEYLDVLGAWDWLVNNQHIAPERIGLFGYSGGTGATIIAMGEEPRIAAAWLDSVYADLPTSIVDQLERYGYPAFLMPGGLVVARLHGDNMTAFSPLDAAQKINGRPVFITHSDADPVLSVDYAYRLEAALRADGSNSELWIVSGSGHVHAMFDHTNDYEQRLIMFFDTHLLSR